MPANKSQVRFLITCLAVAWGFFATVSQVFADWSGPTSTPPGGNPSPFVSTDSTSQTKTGTLILNNNFIVSGASSLTNIWGFLGVGMSATNSSVGPRISVQPNSGSSLSIDAGTGAVRSSHTAVNDNDLINKVYLNDSLSVLSYWIKSGANLYTTSTITNIGVGTTSPTSKLHLVNTVGGNGSWTGGLTIENTSASAGEAAVTYKNISTGANRWFTGLNQSDAFDVAYGTSFTDGNSKVRILANGNVGIGTTNPSVKLEVVGTNTYAPLKISRASNDKQAGISYYPAGTLSNSNKGWMMGLEENSNDFSFYNWNGSGAINNVLYLTNTNNVGIGTDNPTGKFVIKQSGGNWTDGLNIERSATTDKFNFTHDTAGRLLIGYNSAKALGIFSSGISVGSYAATTPPSDGMIIPGNVGIGTTNPGAYKLAVNGTANFTGQVTVPTPTATSSAANKSYVDSVALGAQNALWNLDGSSLRPTSTTWNVAIGTTSTPDAKLQVAGSFHVSGSANSVKLDKLAGTGGRIVMTDAEGNLYATSTSVATGIAVGTTGQTLRHDGTSWVANSFLYNNGTNIGIGTTNPSSTLDVAGTINGTHLKINNNIALNTGSNFLYINVGRNFSSGTYMEGSLAIQTGDIYSYTNEASSLGKTTNYWNNLYVKNGIFKNTVTVGSTSSAVAALDVYGGNVLINDAAITSATPKAAITKTYLDSALSAFNTSTNLWASSAAGTYNVGLGNVLIGTTSPATHKLYVQG
ncbi:MAG TPA: hypothetical protein PLT32_01105, partial [bacterium]|nr:hypothetical protein [bacterium]